MVPLPVPDDEAASKVRHELEALLLLVRADHVEAATQLLELALQAEGEGQPAHVGRAPALPEVHRPRRALVALRRALARPARAAVLRLSSRTAYYIYDFLRDYTSVTVVGLLT